MKFLILILTLLISTNLLAKEETAVDFLTLEDSQFNELTVTYSAGSTATMADLDEDYQLDLPLNEEENNKLEDNKLKE